MNHTAAKTHKSISNTTEEALGTSRQLLFLKSPENPLQVINPSPQATFIAQYMVTANELSNLIYVL